MKLPSIFLCLVAATGCNSNYHWPEGSVVLASAENAEWALTLRASIAGVDTNYTQKLYFRVLGKRDSPDRADICLVNQSKHGEKQHMLVFYMAPDCRYTDKELALRMWWKEEPWQRPYPPDGYVTLNVPLFLDSSGQTGAVTFTTTWHDETPN